MRMGYTRNEGVVMEDHTCPECGREFGTKRGLGVHHSRSHGTLLPNQQCSNCDSEFHEEYEKKYCSTACRDEAVSFEGSNNPNYRSKSTTATCKICEGSFEYYPSDKRGLYCPTCVETEQWQTTPTVRENENPRWNGGKRTVSCAMCGTTIERWPSEIGDVTVCGQSCRETWLSEAFSGDGHPNWKGGGNGAYGTGWSKVRERALQRDGYQCRLCRKTREEIGRNPDVHHIVPVRWFIDSKEHMREDAHFIENVISLCLSCHRKAEFGKISRERLRKLAHGSLDIDD